jgi:putative ABC transport system permease protein
MAAGAALLIRSVANLYAIDPGVDTKGVAVLDVTLAGNVPAPKRQQTIRELVDALAAMPGVRGAAATHKLPLRGSGDNWGISIEGKPDLQQSTTAFRIVTPGYFETMRLPLVAGRYFDARDAANANPVAVVDETLARRFWPNEDPLGKRISFENRGTPDDPRPNWREIVGVVRHVRHYRLETESFVEAYAPFDQLPIWMQKRRPAMSLVARTAGDPLALAAAVRGEVRGLDPEVAVFGVNTMNGVLSGAVAQRRVSTWLLAAFAAVALVLAIVGVYGVLAYAVAQRTREIGIRMALGARGSDVLRMVLGQGMLLALAGVGIGICGALLLTRLMTGLLYGVSAADPAVYGAVALLLVAVALLACLVPARRAAKVDPMVALRYE